LSYKITVATDHKIKVFVKRKSILNRVLHKEGTKISTYGRVNWFCAQFNEQTVKILISIKLGKSKTVYVQHTHGGECGGWGGGGGGNFQKLHLHALEGNKSFMATKVSGQMPLVLITKADTR
jgi:hypothetical protein